MKVKKQGWISLYRDIWGGYYGMSVFRTEEDAKRHTVKNTNLVTTIQIEWEEEE